MTMTEAGEPRPEGGEEKDSVRPIPDEAMWRKLYEAYKAVKKDTDKDDVALFQKMDARDNGFKVPIEIRQSPGKGRGVFFTGFVPKGTMICEDRSGKFYTEAQWREFLRLLPHHMAQDCCLWAYVEKDGVVYLDFSEAALFNHGNDLDWWESLCPCSKKEQEANVVEKEMDGTHCYLASRDIQADEELLCDYDSFHDDTVSGKKVPWFDEIWCEYLPDGSDS